MLFSLLLLMHHVCLNSGLLHNVSSLTYDDAYHDYYFCSTKFFCSCLTQLMIEHKNASPSGEVMKVSTYMLWFATLFPVLLRFTINLLPLGQKSE